MLSFVSTRLFPRQRSSFPAAVSESASEVLDKISPASLSPDAPELSKAESTLLLTFGWISAGLGAVALGLFVGRELRQRYKFNRRTPYDFYAHSGDELSDVEFGVGI